MNKGGPDPRSQFRANQTAGHPRAECQDQPLDLQADPDDPDVWAYALQECKRKHPFLK